MELRVLLFTSDGGSTASLCQVLTSLRMQAEICSEMLVAAQRMATENYDAVIVDWDLEEESTFLLRSGREQKSTSLNLALVHDDASIARALQQGANSVIKKPIDAMQARETLSTACELILSRHPEFREPHAAVEPLETAPVEQTQPRRTGFLAQSLTRSALEAEQNVSKRPDTPGELNWQAARGPASMEAAEPHVREAQPVSKQRWDEVKSIFRGQSEEAPAPSEASPQPQEEPQIFSSLALQEESEPSEGSSPPRYLILAVVACVLVAAVLYVWAPGDSYLGRVSSALHSLSAKSRSKAPPIAPQTEAHAEKPPAIVANKPVEPAPTKAPDGITAEPAPIDALDVETNKIQIIETKAIPKSGAQQPPITVPPPDSDQAKALASAESNSPQVVVNEAAAPQSTPQSIPQSTPPPMPVTAKPAPRPVTRVPEDSLPAPGGRVGVIIPDSLRNTPAASPASALEPFTIPEAISSAWIIHRVDPSYPTLGVPQRLEGPVVLQAWVAKDGTIRDLKLVKGYFMLGRAAIDAVRQWRFKPYTPYGKPTEFQTSVTVNFSYPR